MPNNRPAVLEGCCAPLMSEVPGEGDARALATVFKALADPVRLRLVSLIASNPSDEVCVCDLSGSFPLTQPTISHHLRVLREAGLIDCQRRGTRVYYWIMPGVSDRIAEIFGGFPARA